MEDSSNKEKQAPRQAPKRPAKPAKRGRIIPMKPGPLRRLVILIVALVILFGLGSVGYDHDWSGDCAEVLRDLAEISRLDANVSGEEDEAACVEVSEFIRVGVQIIRGELQEPTLPNRYLH